MNDQSIMASSSGSSVNVYICAVCSKPFLSSTSHSRHVSHHFRRHLPADSDSTTDFRVHVACKKFRCFECDKTFFSMFARTKHQRRHLFSTCRFDMVRRSWQRLMKKGHVGLDACYTCDLCAKVFRFRPCFLIHLQHHGFVANAQKVVTF